MTVNRFENTLKEFDKINAGDPHKERVNGVEMPKELIYSQRMIEVLHDFYPEAPEILQLAARGQHIQRWAIPREAYPMDRKGYLMWRTRLKRFHAEVAGSIMEKQGYPAEEIQKMDDFLNKRNLKTDKEVQILEDVACLVFLKYYFDEFIPKHEESKLIAIVHKTWNKMSTKGQETALKIRHSPQALSILKKAGL